MLRFMMAVALLAMAGVASPQGTETASATPTMASETPMPGLRKPCEELKAEIDAKIRKNGVPMFTLDVLEMDAEVTEGKVVGTCDGQTRKIVYKRG